MTFALAGSPQAKNSPGLRNRKRKRRRQSNLQQCTRRRQVTVIALRPSQIAVDCYPPFSASAINYPYAFFRGQRNARRAQHRSDHYAEDNRRSQPTPAARSLGRVPAGGWKNCPKKRRKRGRQAPLTHGPPASRLPSNAHFKMEKRSSRSLERALSKAGRARKAGLTTRGGSDDSPPGGGGDSPAASAAAASAASSSA